jgi:hypothetical protein
VFSNSTQIFFAKDLQISRSQRNRRMATIAMDVERQLANRGIELKFDLTRAGILYGELNATTAAGSDTQYRTLKGMRAHFRQYGLTNSTAQSLGTSLNAYNTTVVNTGKYPDRLLIGTDLVASIAGYRFVASAARRDRHRGRLQVQVVQLNQGNKVEIIIDGRVNTGDAFLYGADQVTAHPFVGSGMFVIAATDFVDGVKRRLGAEWGLKVQHPECGMWLSAKTT